MDFESVIQEIKSKNWNVHGLEVYKDGELLHSFGDTERKYAIYSATKSVLSLAAGIAKERGLFDINECVLEYLPKENIAKMSAEKKTAWKKIRVKNLLSMSVSHLPFQVAGKNYLDYALSFAAETFGAFNYSNNSAYLVGAALSGAIGGDAGKFIEENIFSPLKIQDFCYERSPEGIFYGASKMQLSVHSLSKIALVLYNGGTFKNKRIVSSDWVNCAQSVQQMNSEGGYGYFLWKYRDGFSINGKWGQKSYILPREKLVITHLSDLENDEPLKKCIEKHLLSAPCE